MSEVLWVYLMNFIVIVSLIYTLFTGTKIIKKLYGTTFTVAFPNLFIGASLLFFMTLFHLITFGLNYNSHTILFGLITSSFRIAIGLFFAQAFLQIYQTYYLTSGFKTFSEAKK